MYTLPVQQQPLKKLHSGVNVEFLDAIDTVTVERRFDVVSLFCTTNGHVLKVMKEKDHGHLHLMSRVHDLVLLGVADSTGVVA
jgi:hypothetical protein